MPFQEVYEKADKVDYYKGEDKVSEKWANRLECRVLIWKKLTLPT